MEDVFVFEFGFSALQRAENFSIIRRGSVGDAFGAFQCSSASRKFLNRLRSSRLRSRVPVSVLFSEPKISQLYVLVWLSLAAAGFSALQRAENFSIIRQMYGTTPALMFQCSSASRKFLNGTGGGCGEVAEEFQCSSASRKFLNRATMYVTIASAAFQCSSASRKFLNQNRLES